MFPSSSSTPSKNFVVVPYETKLVLPLAFLRSIPPLFKTTCVSIVSIAAWAAPAELDTVFKALAADADSAAIEALTPASKVLRLVCTAVVAAAADADSAEIEALTPDSKVLSDDEVSKAVFSATAALADASVAFDSATAALAEATLAEAAAPAPKSTSDVEPADIVIWPATCTFTPSNLIWLPSARPAKNAPLLDT